MRRSHVKLPITTLASQSQLQRQLKFTVSTLNGYMTLSLHPISNNLRNIQNSCACIAYKFNFLTLEINLLNLRFISYLRLNRIFISLFFFSKISNENTAPEIKSQLKKFKLKIPPQKRNKTNFKPHLIHLRNTVKYNSLKTFYL